MMKRDRDAKPLIPWRTLIVVGTASDAERQTELLAAFMCPGARVLLPSGVPVSASGEVDWSGSSALVMVEPPHGRTDNGDWAGASDISREIINPSAGEGQR
jgi:hypothetical protein